MKRFRDYINGIDNQIYSEHWKSHDVPVAHLYYQDVSLSDIKQETGLSFGEIYRSLHRHGIQPHRRKKPNHDNIQYYNLSGYGLDEIAKMTGYTSRHIRNVINARNNDTTI